MPDFSSARSQFQASHAAGEMTTYAKRVPHQIPTAEKRYLAATQYGMIVRMPVLMNDLVRERENPTPWARLVA